VPCQPAPEYGTTLRFMMMSGGFFMLKILLKMKYAWHLLRFRYNELLLKDCLSNELRAKLEKKAMFHERKALSLLIKI
jgi:hypothetical protein